MTKLIVNPLPSRDLPDAVERVREWLDYVAKLPSGVTAPEAFDEKWGRLSPVAMKVLDCLVDEGGERVKESSLRPALQSKHKMTPNEANKAVRDAGLEFVSTDLVMLLHGYPFWRRDDAPSDLEVAINKSDRQVARARSDRVYNWWDLGFARLSVFGSW